MIAYNSDPDKAAVHRWQIARNAVIRFQDAAVPLKPFSTVVLSSLAAIQPAALADLLEAKHRVVAIAEGIDTRAESGLGDVELRTVVKFAGFLRSLPAATGDSKPDGSVATMKAEIERLTGNAIDFQCALNESRAETETARDIERRIRAMCLAKESESTTDAVESMLGSLAEANAERQAVAAILGADIGQLAEAAQALVDDYKTLSGGAMPDAQSPSPQPNSRPEPDAVAETSELRPSSASSPETPANTSAGTAESPPRRGPGRPRATPKPQAPND